MSTYDEALGHIACSNANPRQESEQERFKEGVGWQDLSLANGAEGELHESLPF